MTLIGREATNVYLHRTWDDELRLFTPGEPALSYPIVFGYRAAGEVAESRDSHVAVGDRIYGNWRHTEFSVLGARRAEAQRLPHGLSIDDGVDIAQMGPICLNAVAHAGGAHVRATAAVFGAGPVGLITAQVVRASGARRVFVVDRLAYRLAVAERLGLEPVDASATDVAVMLKSELGQGAIAVAFECTGSTRALHEAIRTVRRRGVVVAVGFYQGEGTGLFLGDEFHHNGVQIRSGQIGNLHPAWSWRSLRRRTIELVESGQLVLGGLPRLTLPVERAADGFEALRRPDEVLQVAFSYGVAGERLRAGAEPEAVAA